MNKKTKSYKICTVVEQYVEICTVVVPDRILSMGQIELFDI